jgi:hypothetical protein
MEKFGVSLSHGFEYKGAWINKVYLRQICGFDQEYLMETEHIPTPIRVTGLLERIVTFENIETGSNQQHYQENKYDLHQIARNLTVGDRAVLMLNLRRLTFGENLQLVIVCPKCKMSMSSDISIDSLLKPHILSPSPSSSYSSFIQNKKESEYTIHAKNFLLKVRPITGADQELLLLEDNMHDSTAAINNNNNYSSIDNSRNLFSDKTEKLAKSCIISSHPQLANDNIDKEILEAINSKLVEIDPHADIILELVCPSCQDHFKTQFIVEDFIFQEIHLLELEREVHWLALNYHWNEDTILSLPIRKRKRYVELINKSLSGGSI